MILEKYGDTRVARIDRSVFSDYKMYNKYLHLHEKDTILEIWPGNWSFSLYLKERFNIPEHNITLLDASSSTVHILKKQPETEKFNIIESDVIDYLKNNQKKYTLIVMKYVLEHMEKPYINNLIPLLLDALTEHGTLLIEVPNIWNTPYGVFWAFADYTHYTYFTHESLVQCILWNNTKNIKLDIKTRNIYPNIIFKPKLFYMIKSIIAFILRWISIIISYCFMRINWDNTWTWEVFTPFILALIKKKWKNL